MKALSVVRDIIVISLAYVSITLPAITQSADAQGGDPQNTGTIRKIDEEIAPGHASCDTLPKEKAALCRDIIRLRFNTQAMGQSLRETRNRVALAEVVAARKKMERLTPSCVSGDKTACAETRWLAATAEQTGAYVKAQSERGMREDKEWRLAVSHTAKIVADSNLHGVRRICKAHADGSINCISVAQLVAATDSKLAAIAMSDLSLLTKQIGAYDKNTLVDCGFGIWSATDIHANTATTGTNALTAAAQRHLLGICGERMVDARVADLPGGGGSTPQLPQGYSGITGLGPAGNSCAFNPTPITGAFWARDVVDNVIAVRESCSSVANAPYAGPRGRKAPPRSSSRSGGEPVKQPPLEPLIPVIPDWRRSPEGSQPWGSWANGTMAIEKFADGRTTVRWKGDVVDANGNVMGNRVEVWGYPAGAYPGGTPSSGAVVIDYKNGSFESHTYNKDGSSVHKYYNADGKGFTQSFNADGKGGTYTDSDGNVIATDKDGNMTSWTKNGAPICGGSSGNACTASSASTTCDDIELCSGCSSVLGTLPRTIGECALGGGRSQVCQRWLAANKCCKNLSLDPKAYLVMPNPVEGEGLCHTSVVDRTVSRCKLQCTVASNEEDCLSQCSDSFQRIDTSSLVDRVCVYAIWDACFVSGPTIDWTRGKPPRVPPPPPKIDERILAEPK